jgi:ribosome-associated protein
VTSWFDVVGAPSLSPDKKELILRRLGGRIGKDGFLQVISQQTLSQAANRQLATDRFVELLRDAVKPVPISKMW